MKEMVLKYFKDLFDKDETCDINARPRGGFLIIKQATMEEVMKEIREEDIKYAIMEMVPLKTQYLTAIMQRSISICG